MDVQIEPYMSQQLAAVVELSLRAWAPVFESLQSAMDPEVFQTFYPDWRAAQGQAVAAVCADPEIDVWVALVAAVPAGFVAVKLDGAASMGEIYMVAVDPARQGQGIGTALTTFALERMRAAGMAVAMVETGGDPGHAPARSTYEKAGFRLLPIARYFKKL